MKNSNGDDRPIQIAKELYRSSIIWMSAALAEIADLVHLTTSYFSTLFKSRTGVNFNKYLASYRISAAKKLLRETNMNIHNIGVQVGYKDNKYFRSIFKKELGVTPVDYRNLYR